MDNLRGLPGIRRIDKLSSDERIHEGFFRWFSHMERMENDGIA